MYELLLVACIGTRMCEYVMPPVAYTSETKCETQAAVIAGMMRGRHAPGLPFTYRFTCQPQRFASVSTDTIQTWPGSDAPVVTK